MKWLEFVVQVPPHLAEAAAAILAHYTEGGVSIEEPFTALAEGIIEPRTDQPVRVAAYLSEPAATPARRRALRRALASQLGLQAGLTVQLRNEEEWAEAWKQFFHVERFGRIVIRPSWRTYRPSPGEVVIDLDPGMAFGTGQHPTTQRALLLLDRLVRPGMRVLDLGTGSGILAIAAAKLGAHEVLAVDIDRQAVQVAQANVDRNRVGDTVQVACGSLGSHWPFGKPPTGDFDLVLANTSAATIILLAADLLAALKRSGRLVAGGIIQSYEGEVRRILTSTGAQVLEVIQDGDWYTFLVGKRDG